MDTKPPQSIAIRDASAADAAEVARLLALLGHTAPPGNHAARLAAHLALGERVLVASRSPAASAPLLGVATLHVTPMLHRAGPVGRITALVVDDDARGQGVGRALVDAAESQLATQGCPLIEITSNRQRTDAHAFYERLGYTATSFRFAKTLAPATTEPRS